MSAQAILDARNEAFEAIRALDGDALQQRLLTVHERYGNDSLVADVLIPVLRQVGDRWESGQLGVLHEHHASAIIRSIVGSLRGVSSKVAGTPPVVLACPPGELHDLPHHLFSLMLVDRGLHPIVLGANTPWKALAAVARSNQAAGYVLSGINPTLIDHYVPVLATLNADRPVFLAGPLASTPLPGITQLPNDWRQAAAIVQAALAPVAKMVD